MKTISTATSSPGGPRKANVRYILSKDILKHRRAQKEEADAWLGKGATWEDELLRVTATGSNDSGVSWVIETDGKRIFHAGDLNNWYARFLTDDYYGDWSTALTSASTLTLPRKKSVSWAS